MIKRLCPDAGFQKIPGFNYQISVDGRVKPIGGGLCLPSYSNNRGHLMVYIPRAGKRVAQMVHKLILEAFAGPPPKGKRWARFKDENRKNIHLDNLYWSAQRGSGKVRNSGYQSNYKIGWGTQVKTGDRLQEIRDGISEDTGI